MYEKPTSTIQGPNLSCDWPAATSVYLSPFEAISLVSTIVVTGSPPALLNKVSPLISIWDCNLCTEVWKDNCSCNWYLFSSQSVGKLFRTVTLNKLSDSFGCCCCYLKTSLLLHLHHTHSSLCNCLWLFLYSRNNISQSTSCLPLVTSSKSWCF